MISNKKVVDNRKEHFIKEDQCDREADKPRLLLVKDLSKIFDGSAGKVVALDRINLQIMKGEFVSIIGPSGSGKSNLLNMIGALDKPTLGKVFINDVDIFSGSDSEIAKIRNNMIGFIFQSYNLVNRMSVKENVEFPCLLVGTNETEMHHHSQELLEVLGIGNKSKSKPSNLSGGEQQRVAIARALMNDPVLILADEPTGNLDTKTGQGVFDLFKKLSINYRKTVIMVTHNQEFAKSTDRSLYIRDGSIEKEVVN